MVRLVHSVAMAMAGSAVTSAGDTPFLFRSLRPGHAVWETACQTRIGFARSLSCRVTASITSRQQWIVRRLPRVNAATLWHVCVCIRTRQSGADLRTSYRELRGRGLQYRSAAVCFVKAGMTVPHGVGKLLCVVGKGLFRFADRKIRAARWAV